MLQSTPLDSEEEASWLQLESLLMVPPSKITAFRHLFKVIFQLFFSRGKLSCWFRKIICFLIFGNQLLKDSWKDHESSVPPVIFFRQRRVAQQVMVHPAEIPEANDGFDRLYNQIKNPSPEKAGGTVLRIHQLCFGSIWNTDPFLQYDQETPISQLLRRRSNFLGV